jgi:hypothetical protein
MGYLSDYLMYNSGNECPPSFHIWSGLALLSSVVSRKVFVEYGYFNVHPNLYVCLVAEQGSRKTSAKDIACDILIEEFPHIPRSKSVMSKEAITQFLGSPESVRTFIDHKGILTEYHPFSLFINELKNFISINPMGMIDFLTDIYDQKLFDVGTKNKGVDIIPNPYMVMLACETPQWIASRLKMDIISGGFARRVMFVYEVEEPIRIPFPEISPERLAAKKAVIAQLHRAEELVGPFQWTPESRKFFEEWYKKVPTPADALMRGYMRSKHIQLLKVCMLLAAVDDNKLILERHHLEMGLKVLNAIEPNMERLAIGAGRNELIQPTARLLDLVKDKGGMVPEKELMKFCFRDMSPQEAQGVILHLERTDQIVRLRKVDKQTGVARTVIALREFVNQLTADGKVVADSVVDPIVLRPLDGSKSDSSS